MASCLLYPVGMNRLAAVLLAISIPFAALANERPAEKGPIVELTPKLMRQIVREAHSDRIDGLRQRSRFFSKITQGKQYTGERIVGHKPGAGGATAFLDMTDPQHPRFDPKMEDEDESQNALPANKRTHILVVPNTPREHIGKSVTGTIDLDDINATKATLEYAHTVAKDLGVKNPRIFINTQDRLSVGYQHVHIVGERTQQTYPDLKP